jgi:hypothetical protein
MMNLFGYQITRKIDGEKKTQVDKKPSERLLSAVPQPIEDGAVTISAGGYYGQYLDIDGTTVTNTSDLILKYRQAAEHPECDGAISDIVNEAITSKDSSVPVSLNLDDLNLSKSIKKQIHAEFDNVLKSLDFNQNCSEIFRRWYVDGRMFYHVVTDPNRLQDGIIELRQIDPVRIRKVREVATKIDPLTRVNTTETVAEYFVYSDAPIQGNTSLTVEVGSTVSGVKIDPNAIIYVPSGLLDHTRKHVISHLHKALKPVNQLRMMEDALVIYRISRAPERRIFYIDVGNLPKGKAEEYVQGLMSKYRNKLVYDASTGEIRDDRRHMSMLEDFWLPRREGGKGTEITTLPGGQNLGEIEDILFFQKKLFKSLNVPMSRLETESGFNIGRATEISREEVKFQKFIDSLRRRFSYLLIESLRIQLILKNVTNEEDWDDSIKENISVTFARDNYFTELKEFEIFKERMDILGVVSSHVGKYYSEQWVRKNILRQTDEDIERMDMEIKDEGAKKQPEDFFPNEDETGVVEEEEMINTNEDEKSEPN